MCMYARMRRLVWSGDGTYVRIPWPARGKICACVFLVRTMRVRGEGEGLGTTYVRPDVT